MQAQYLPSGAHRIANNIVCCMEMRRNPIRSGCCVLWTPISGLFVLILRFRAQATNYPNLYSTNLGRLTRVEESFECGAKWLTDSSSALLDNILVFDRIKKMELVESCKWHLVTTLCILNLTPYCFFIWLCLFTFRLFIVTTG